MNVNPAHPSTHDTHAKALAINLDGSFYGAIAEIGAGQEVARWFLKVGAASGTVAQTISAYDKIMSDAIYGAGTRYVSKERLLAMLDHEYRQIVARLGSARGTTTKFFAFADTASARNYAGDNLQHAWIGIRFQTIPEGEPSDVRLHVSLTDPTNQGQQDALGVLGVNLIHAVHYHRTSVDDFLNALWCELSLDRLEIDVLEFEGPALPQPDPATWGLSLLRHGMGRVQVFGAEGQVVEPGSVLRKRALLIDRGRATFAGPDHATMLAVAERCLRGEGIPLERDPVRVVELSLNPVDGNPPEEADVLDRISALAPLGTVLVSTFTEGYALAEYLRRYTTEPVRFVVGISLLARLLQDQFYHRLPGRLLEGLGKLLALDAKIYAFPMSREAVLSAIGPSGDAFAIEETASGEVTADGLRPHPPVDHLYRYLREGGWIVAVPGRDVGSG